MKDELFTTKSMVLMALFAAITCILAPMALPIGPVPISLTNLVLYFSLYLQGTKRASISFIVYVLIGLVGLPVFSGFTGGPAKLMGPTGGYIVGFLPMVILAGLIVEKTKGSKIPSFIGMVLGTLVCYALGTFWFVTTMGCEWGYALSICVFPFLLGDFCKILAATLLGSVLRQRLVKARLLEPWN